MADDRIELKLEIDGEEQATDLAAAATKAKAAFDALTSAVTTTEAATTKAATGKKKLAEQTYELSHAEQLEAMQLDHVVEMLRHEERQLEAVRRAEDEQIAALGREIAAENASTVAVDKKTAALKGTAGGFRAAQQGALDISRALQDFAQGGFGGILNNLEGLGRAIPALLANPMALLTSIPGMLTLVGVAVWQFGGTVYDALRHAVGGSNAIPEATDRIKRLEEQLKKTTTTLDKYRESGNLTNFELREYNRLTEESIRLEKLKAEELKKAADLKALQAKKSPEEEARASAQKQIVGDAVGGHQKGIEGALASTIDANDRATMFGDQRILEGQIANAAPGIQKQLLERRLQAIKNRIRRSLQGEFFAASQKQAEEMLAAAMAGEEGALDRAVGLMGQNDRFGIGGDLENQANQFRTATRAGQKGAKDEGRLIARQQKDAKAKAEAKAENEKRIKAAEDHEQEVRDANDKQAAAERKIADDKADAEAKAALANPDAAAALRGPGALLAAQRRLGQDQAHARAGGGGGGGAGGGGGGGGHAVPGGPRAAILGGGGGFAVAGDQVDAVPGGGGRAARPRTVAERIRAGQARTVAKQEAAEAKKQKLHDARMDRRTAIAFDVGLRKPLPNTIIGGRGGGGSDPAAAAAATAARQEALKQAMAATRAADDTRRAEANARFRAVVAGVAPRAPSVLPGANRGVDLSARAPMDHAATAGPPRAMQGAVNNTDKLIGVATNLDARVDDQGRRIDALVQKAGQRGGGKRR